ncbi:MAG: PepSY-like domain-containing protein [Chitinophagaceae bacterium]|nr:PepSY-like domain-containing protein [Chitinophagaceae bacterium]
MKIKSISLLAFFALLLTSCDSEKVMQQTDIPSVIETYVSTYFPDHKILQVVEDKDDLTLTYDVLLDGGVSLEFNRNKEIIGIDSKSALPESVIPRKIRDYVAANFSSNIITDWEIDGKKQQISLDNGFDIEFTRDGDFIRIDK